MQDVSKIMSESKSGPNKIKQTEKEIEEIGIVLYHKIALWVKQHPVLTLLFSFLLSVASNLVSQWLWNLFN